MRRYLSESHKAYSEACQKEVEEMRQHPLTHEEFLEQIERQRKASNLQGEDVEDMTEAATYQYLCDTRPDGAVALSEEEAEKFEMQEALKGIAKDVKAEKSDDKLNYILSKL